MKEKVTWTKDEVQSLVGPLLDQIEFLLEQNRKAKDYILKPWYCKPNKYDFIAQTIREENDSNTIIFNLVQLSSDEFDKIKKTINDK